MDEVSGSVDYNLRGQLPSDSQLVVELRDTTSVDAAGFPISKDSFEVKGLPPHSFRLKYPSRSVGETNTYSLEAWIETADGQVLFDAETDYSVITQGNPNRVSISLNPTPLAENLIDNNQQIEEPARPTKDESELVETVPVSSRPEATANPTETTVEQSGGGGIAFFLILAVAIGFIVVLVARHKATRPTEETVEDDFIDDSQD